MTHSTTASELAALLDAGRHEDAIVLCRRHAEAGSGSSYYRFWLDRLTRTTASAAAPAAPKVTPEPPVLHEFLAVRASPPGSPSLHARMRQDLAAAFTPHAYRLVDEPLPTPSTMEAVRESLVKTSPFSGAIYQPTQKISPADQVRGLRRVRQLAAPEHLAVSAERFRLLREWVRQRGARRVFVIGNGPSLKRTDLSLLKDEITIGFNGIFLHEHFTPTIYVVEDHLVAEDRVREIHDYVCPVKVFPSYLGYCIDPQDNTIFLNHRSRISYPVDTDFSADAGRITYTGGTVTYTGLQIAASLGVEEIVLIGVDASYEVHNVDRSDSYGTGVLTSKEDDSNHFDPRYFGKGYRWHDPNVHTMLQAYRKAREHGRRHGVRIVNAGIGGQLEVFPRVDYHQLFPVDRVFPRLAVLDFTSVSRTSATGVIKRNLLRGWPGASQFHVFADDGSRLKAFQSVPNDLYAVGADENSAWPALRSLIEYDPQVLYLRPTEDRIPMTVLQAVAATILDRPWVVHYMDDWLQKAGQRRGAAFGEAQRELMRWFFAGASQVLSICDKMSAQLVREFGLPRERVHAVHNLLPDDPPRPRVRAAGDDAERLVRYFGAIEPDMGLATLVDFARRVHRHNAARPAQRLRFEICTGAHAITAHAGAFEGLDGVQLVPQLPDYADYLEAIGSSDLNLICYNFDGASLAYVRYSLANKLPELIASGVPFLAIGHPEIGTLELLAQHGYPLCARDEGYDFDALMRQAFTPDAAELQAWRDSVKALRQEFSVENNRHRLHALLRAAAAAGVPPGRSAPPRDAVRRISGVIARHPKHWGEVDIMLALLWLPRPLLHTALQRVRTHGLEWSVRDESAALATELAQGHLAAAPQALQARGLAFLIASLGDKRFSAVNNPVRDWLRTLLA